MPILKTECERNFTVLPNDTVVQNDDLSLKARGLLAFLLSFPADWEFRLSDLVGRIPDGKSALRSGLAELAEHGFLYREERYGEDGGRRADAWWVFDAPRPEFDPDDRTDPPRCENPTGGGAKIGSTPRCENRTPTKKQEQSTKNDLEPKAGGAADSETQNKPHPLEEPVAAVRWVFDHYSLDPKDPDEPRLDRLQFRAEWERITGDNYRSNHGKELAARTLCELWPAEDLRGLLEELAEIHPKYRWPAIAIELHTLADQRAGTGVDRMPYTEFRRRWKDVTEKHWPDSQITRAGRVLLTRSHSEVAEALGRTSEADYPGWAYFSTVLFDEDTDHGGRI